MELTRRDFLRYCGISAATLGLSALDLGFLEKALGNPNAPSVIWLMGASCTGCSVSLLNRISTTAPTNAADLLTNSINLIYHPNIMSVSGNDAAGILEKAYTTGNYILAVEGGVPTAFNGATCFAYTYNGVEKTFKDVVTQLASKAAKILCIGECASFGGMSAAPPNPTTIQSVSAATGKSTINIAGCPPHPDWIVWVVAQLLIGGAIPLDSNSRPTQFFSRTVHSQCPRRGTDEASTYGVDNRCLREVGCRGPSTYANCPQQLWNNKQNWCIDSNAPCIGCTQPTFPGTGPFYTNGG